MAVKQQAEVTVTDYSDADHFTTWYRLTTSPSLPSAPTWATDAAAIAGEASSASVGWCRTQPAFSTSSGTPYLYECLQTVWGDGTCDWGDVQLSTSFEAAKAAWNAANAAQSAVDNIEIGGRNLALNSKGVHSRTKSTDSAQMVIRQSLSDYGKEVCISGVTVLCSFDARVSSGTHIVRPYLTNSSYDTQHATTEACNATTEWQRFTMQITLTGSIANWQVTASSDTGTNGLTYDVRNFKLELGNKPTDWTLAPEDVEDSIATAQSTADSKALSNSALGLRTITTTDAAELPLKNLTAYGECKQSGTPTPSTLVHIQAVRARNLLKSDSTVSNANGEYGWHTNIGSSPVLESVEMDGFECIHLQASVTDRHVPSIATRHRINLEWGCTYTVVCYVMFDKEVAIAANRPLHYHAGSVATTNEFDTAILNHGGGVSVSLVAPAANTVIPANTWQRIEVRVTTSASAPNASYPYPVFRPMIYGGRTTSESVTMNTWMHSYMFEQGSFAHGYIPYGQIGVESVGKNKLLLPTWSEISSRQKTSYYYNYPLYLEPNTNYYLSTTYDSSGNPKNGGYLLVSQETNNIHWKGIGHQSSGISNGSLTSDANGILYLNFFGTQANYEYFLDHAIPQLEKGDASTSYEPYWHDVSCVDLMGHELYALSDTYRDVLRVDENGRVTLEKRCDSARLSEGTNWSRYAANVYWAKFEKVLSQDVTSGTAHDNTVLLLSDSFVHTTGDVCVWSGGSTGYFTRHAVTAYPNYNHGVFFKVATDYASGADFVADYGNVEFIYPLDEPYTVNLGTIELPTVQDASVVHVDAEIQPVIDGSWWTNAGYSVGKLQEMTQAQIRETTTRVTNTEARLDIAEDSISSTVENVTTIQAAVADMDVTLTEQIVENSTNITQTAESIEALVTGLGQSSYFTQTDDAFTFAIDAAIAEAAKTATNFLSMTSEGVTLANSDSDIRQVMSNTRNVFKTDAGDIAWFGQNEDGIWEMHIATTYAEDMIRFGDYAWIKRQNGNMTIKWLGEVS